MAFLKTLAGTFMLAGMIIGAGMFAIPFAFSQAGFWLGALELVMLGAVVIVIHLSYAEVVLATREVHRLPGYVRIYLGRWGKMISFASIALSALGTLLVYLILGSKFLENALRVGAWTIVPDSAAYGSLLFVLIIACVGAFVTFFSIRGEVMINAILTALLILFIIVLVYALFPFADLTHITGFSVERAFLPYGVLLFSLWGGVVIPDLATFLGRDQRRMKSAVVTGTVIPILVYAAFAFAVIGVSGAQTSREALEGLRGVITEEMVLLGALIGLLAVCTSFIALQKTVQAMLELDLGIHRLVAWVLANTAPVLLYLLGFTDFIVAISIVGAIAIGLDSALILSAHYRMRRALGISFSFASMSLRTILFAIVLGGIIYYVSGGI